jgi:hypothetical protein
MKYLSIEIDSIKMYGKITKAVVRGEPLKLRVEANDKGDNQARPDYKSFDGISVWVKDDSDKGFLE